MFMSYTVSMSISSSFPSNWKSGHAGIRLRASALPCFDVSILNGIVVLPKHKCHRASRFTAKQASSFVTRTWREKSMVGQQYQLSPVKELMKFV